MARFANATESYGRKLHSAAKSVVIEKRGISDPTPRGSHPTNRILKRFWHRSRSNEKKKWKKKNPNLFGGSGLVRHTLQSVMLNAGRCANGGYMEYGKHMLCLKRQAFLKGYKNSRILDAYWNKDINLKNILQY